MANLPGAEKRGPRLGDSASLWNFTPSPGWSKDQVAILRLCLIKYGIGKWSQILDTGLLPGKLIQQLNGQTQRLLGQQSLAAYTGLQVDIDRIRADNELKTDAERKGGLIIWSGPNPTKQMKDEWRREAQAKYGLSNEQIQEAEADLEELLAATSIADNKSAGSCLPLVDLMEEPLEKLSKEQKVQLLRRLRRKLQSLVLSRNAPPAAIGALDVPSANLAQQEWEVIATTEKTSRGKQQVKQGKEGESTDALTSRGERKTSKRSAPNKVPTIKPKRAKAGGKRPSRTARTAKSLEEGEMAARECVEDEEEPQLEVGGHAAATVAVLESDILQLQTMGFSKAKAREALEECQNDLDSAIEWLVANCI